MESSFSISKNFLSKEGKRFGEFDLELFFLPLECTESTAEPSTYPDHFAWLFSGFSEVDCVFQRGGIVKTDAFAHANLR